MMPDLKIPDFQDLDIDDEDLEYEEESEEEGIENYKIGGYHPTYIGEVLGDRYVIMQRLGWGHFSTVWLAKDCKHDIYVAVKIQKSSPSYVEAALDEIEILQTIKRKAQQQESLPIVDFLNAFTHEGPFGTHYVMVFEILGSNMKKQHFTLMQCRAIVRQILIGLDYLHRVCGIIHTDLKPENILLCLHPEEVREQVEQTQLTQNLQFQQRVKQYQQVHGFDEESQMTKQQRKQLKKKRQKQKKKLTRPPCRSKLSYAVKIADLGNACWVHHHFNDLIQTRPYRAPEVILGHHYSTSADIWSLGCLVFELVTGDLLFNPQEGAEYGRNDAHLALMIQLLGRFPRNFALTGAHSKHYFDEHSNLRRLPMPPHRPLLRVLRDDYKFPEAEARSLCDFLLPMLNPVPQHRATAYELLRSPWLGGMLRTLKYKGKVQSESDSEREVEGESGSASPRNNVVGKFVDVRFIDRSFTDLGYFGHSQGLDLNALDITSTQFCDF